MSQVSTLQFKGNDTWEPSLGTTTFTHSFVTSKIASWVDEIKRLSSTAKIQPQAAYTALPHGIMGRWAFPMRSLKGIEDQFQSLEDVIRHSLLSVITGHPAISDTERKLIALPVRLGGMGISIPTEMASSQYEASATIKEPLVSSICNQSCNSNETDVNSLQVRMRNELSRCRRQSQQEEAAKLKETLPSTLQISMELASKKGASAWLTAIPIKEYSFTLHKQAFRDALCIPYDWYPTHSLFLWYIILHHTCFQLL